MKAVRKTEYHTANFSQWISIILAHSMYYYRETLLDCHKLGHRSYVATEAEIVMEITPSASVQTTAHKVIKEEK